MVVIFTFISSRSPKEYKVEDVINISCLINTYAHQSHGTPLGILQLRDPNISVHGAMERLRCLTLFHMSVPRDGRFRRYNILPIKIRKGLIPRMDGLYSNLNI